MRTNRVSIYVGLDAHPEGSIARRVINREVKANDIATLAVRARAALDDALAVAGAPPREATDPDPPSGPADPVFDLDPAEIVERLRSGEAPERACRGASRETLVAVAAALLG